MNASVDVLVKDGKEEHEDQDSSVPENRHAAGHQLLEHLQLHLLWQWHEIYHYVKRYSINIFISGLEMKQDEFSSKWANGKSKKNKLGLGWAKLNFSLAKVVDED